MLSAKRIILGFSNAYYIYKLITVYLFSNEDRTEVIKVVLKAILGD